MKNEVKNHDMEQKENETKTNTESSYHIGYTNRIPVTLYFDKGYVNSKIEFAIDRKTWKVYFFGVYVGDINDDGGLHLNVEDIEDE